MDEDTIVGPDDAPNVTEPDETQDEGLDLNSPEAVPVIGQRVQDIYNDPEMSNADKMAAIADFLQLADEPDPAALSDALANPERVEESLRKSDVKGIQMFMETFDGLKAYKRKQEEAVTLAARKKHCTKVAKLAGLSDAQITTPIMESLVNAPHEKGLMALAEEWARGYGIGPKSTVHGQQTAPRKTPVDSLADELNRNY